MATFTANSNGIYAKLVVTEQSQSVANNTTTLLWEIYMWNTTAKPNWYMYDQHNIFQVKINGEYVLNNSDFGRVSLQYEQPESAARLITSGTYTIAHNSDGTKTGVPVYLYAAQGWEYAYVWETSGTMNLTTIARASQPSLSASSITLGSAVTIYTNRASSSFTHTLEYAIGSASGTIASGVGDKYDSWPPSKELARQFPNATSGVVTITCKTYNGSTLIGTKQTFLTINISSDMIPSVSATISEAASIPSGISGYIKTRSKLRIVASASGLYGATIMSYKITANGSTYNASEATTGYLTTAGSNTITVTVTDSRGQSKTYSTTVTVLDYSPPRLDSWEATRCDANGNLTDDGGYFKVIVSGVITQLTNYSSGNCRFRYKKTSETSWSDYILLIVPTFTFSNISSSPVLADTSSSYDIQVVVYDNFGDSAPYTTAVSTASILINVLENRDGIAIGKMAEKAKTVQLGWDLELKGDPTADNHAATKSYVDTIANPSQVHYSNTYSDSSGYYQIYINSTKEWMLNFTIRVYHSYWATDIMISGYNYGPYFWYSPSAVILGSSQGACTNVIFGYDSAYNLWVAIPAGMYTGLDIFNVTNGYVQVDSYKNLFTVARTTSLTGTIQTTVNAYPPYYRGQTVDVATNAAALALPRVDGVDALAYALTLPEGSTTTVYFATGCTNLPIGYMICRISRSASGDCTITGTYVGNGNTFRNATSNNGASWTGWVMELDMGNVSDYPVAQATSGHGIWSFIKFNSGIAMCWGRTAVYNTTFPATWGSWRVNDYLFPAQRFPFDFVAIPHVFASQGNPGTTACDWAIYSDGGATTQYTPKYSVFRPAAVSATVNLSLNLFAIGRWK